MSDINGRGVLHVVSEHKVTRTDKKKFLEKYFFSKVFLEEVLSKKKNMLFKESFYEKHNPK